jgi:hypothetical protein
MVRRSNTNTTSLVHSHEEPALQDSVPQALLGKDRSPTLAEEQVKSRVDFVAADEVFRRAPQHKTSHP